MEVSLDGNELSLIPQTDADFGLIKRFMAMIEQNDNRLVDAELDGVNLDELVLSPFCKVGASHCQLCGKPNAD